jgi:glycosyltransferase involved in cell wall biosynthesis
MKIVHVVPGSGGTFYCENCLRDTSVVRALRGRGHEIVLVPMYLPLLRAHDDISGEGPLFFGGVNAWLQEHVPLFRHTPRWVDGLLDAPPLLRLAAAQAGSPRAHDLGPMTLSMLRGEEGHQAKELERLAGWLADEVRPDVVHLSNALLLGLARRVRERTGAAIVCSLQDEAPWVDAMAGPWPARVWGEIGARAGDVDAFIAVSRHYAGVMERRAGIPAERVRVVPIGVDVASYAPAPHGSPAPVIGYLARMSEASGLGDLVEAFLRLRESRPALRLALTGGKTRDDDRFLDAVRERIARAGAAQSVTFLEDFGAEARRRFLASLTVLSVPGTGQTAFGLYVLEALAAGVPAVQPRAGAFPELIEPTGGGLLYDPEEPGALERALAEVVDDPGRARELGRRARDGAARLFSVEAMAAAYLDVYRVARG